MKLRPPGEVRECRKALRHDVGFVARQFEHVHRFVKARVRVDVRSEPRTSRLEVLHELSGSEVLAAVERHVLDEVREPLLVGVFLERAGFHGQSKQHAFRGPGVLADEELKAVWQRAADDRAVKGNRFLWIERPGRRRLREQPGRRQDDSETQKNDGQRSADWLCAYGFGYYTSHLDPSSRWGPISVLFSHVA